MVADVLKRIFDSAFCRLPYLWVKARIPPAKGGEAERGAHKERSLKKSFRLLLWAEF